jgi:hypothetical protein
MRDRDGIITTRKAFDARLPRSRDLDRSDAMRNNPGPVWKESVRP